MKLEDTDCRESVAALEQRVSGLEDNQAEVMNVLARHLALIHGQTTAIEGLLDGLEKLEKRLVALEASVHRHAGFGRGDEVQ